MSGKDGSYVINKKGKIVRRKFHPIKQIIFILIVCFFVWIFLSILVMALSWKVLVSYESLKEGYSMISTVLTNALNLSNSIISGTITGTIAFIGVWWTIKDAREINDQEKSLDIMPSIEPMFILGVGYDNELMDTPYIRMESAFSYEQMDEALGSKPEYVEKVANSDEFPEWSKKSILEDWEAYKRKRGQKTRSHSRKMVIRTDRKTARECALSKDSLFKEDGDACLVMDIHNKGKGDAYLECITCEESGQIWNYRKHIGTGKFDYESVNLVTHGDLTRKICIGFEFRDERGTLYYQRAVFNLCFLFHNRFFKKKSGERTIERYYANVEQPIKILE